MSCQAPQIPNCDKKIGTLAVTEPQDQWWTAMQLDSPAALIKVDVSESKCFTLVDRGKGLQAAQTERALASSGEDRVGSNVGKGQMNAADYVLVPDIANRNRNSGGTNVGGMEHASDGELFAVLLGRDERSNRLRQSPPYVGMLAHKDVEKLNDEAAR